MTAFAYELQRLGRAPGTIKGYARALELFKRFLGPRLKRYRASDLSRDDMKGFWSWLELRETSLHGEQPRAQSTVAKLVERVQLFWQHTYREDTSNRVAAPKPIATPRGESVDPNPPTWAEMDACIAALLPGEDGRGQKWRGNEQARRFALFARMTGLRFEQVRSMAWASIDFTAKTLHVTTGKSAQEKRGRVVPLSAHLLAEIAGWGTRNGRVFEGLEEKSLRRALNRAWERSGVRRDAWEGSPAHAFRDGFMSNLKKARADDEAVRFLVGHSLGVRGRYVGAEFLPLREVVDLVPALTTNNVLALRAKGE